MDVDCVMRESTVFVVFVVSVDVVFLCTFACPFTGDETVTPSGTTCVSAPIEIIELLSDTSSPSSSPPPLAAARWRALPSDENLTSFRRSEGTNSAS